MSDPGAGKAPSFTENMTQRCETHRHAVDNLNDRLGNMADRLAGQLPPPPTLGKEAIADSPTPDGSMGALSIQVDGVSVALERLDQAVSRLESIDV